MVAAMALTTLELKSISLLLIGLVALVMGIVFALSGGLLSFAGLLLLLGLTSIVSSFGRKVPGAHR